MDITQAIFRPEYLLKTETQSRITGLLSRAETDQMLYKATWKVKEKPASFILRQRRWPSYTINKSFQLVIRSKTK